MFVYMPINALYPLITMEYFNGTPMAYFYYGDCLCLWYVDRGSIIRVIWELPKANLINNGIHFYDGDKLNHFRITSPKWIFHICSLLCNNGALVPFYSGVQTALFQEKIKPEYLGTCIFFNWKYHVSCYANWVNSFWILC